MIMDMTLSYEHYGTILRIIHDYLKNGDFGEFDPYEDEESLLDIINICYRRQMEDGDYGFGSFQEFITEWED